MRGDARRRAAWILTTLLAATAPGTRAEEPSRGDDPPAVEPKAADGDAPLPVGFPGATRPGTIEVKDYPAYRSAVARSKDISAGAGDTLFFSLFNHITRRDVAMTAPVINTYESPEMLLDATRRGGVSMEFLYERPDQGEAGPGVGIVRVEDHPAVKVVALGIQGGMSSAQMESGLKDLHAWLEAHADQWVASGSPRRLGYHGPMTPEARRLWEIQIPIAPAGTRANPDVTDSPPER